MAEDESREIKYHTKSPEKVIEELKRKSEQNSKMKKNKKRAVIFLSISILIVSGIALFYFLYERNSRTVSYIRKIHPLVFRVVAEKTYEFGKDTDIKVKVSNIAQRPAGFELKDFQFQIRDTAGQSVYSFRYPRNTTVEMEDYESRIVFDFLRENPEQLIRPGTYTIETRFGVDDEMVELDKQFKVYENIDMSLRLFNDYARPGQTLPVYLSILNNSPEQKNYSLGTYNVRLFKDGEQVGSLRKREEAEDRLKIEQGEKTDFKFGEIDFPDETGAARLEASYFLNDELHESEKEIKVEAINSKPGLKALRILPYTVKVIGVDQSYEAEILIVNDKDREIYEQIKGFEFNIASNDSILYRYTHYDERNLNLFLPPYAKRSIFKSSEWRQISFPQKGKYQVNVSVEMQNGILEYSEELTVENQ